MFEIAFLFTAGFAAGLLNAVAGGGTFLSLPALLYAGIPPISANATATLSALPGYLGSAWAFRRDMHPEGSLKLTVIIGVASVGSVLGALLLVVTPGEAFLWIVPWFLMIATVLFAVGPALLRWMRIRGMGNPGTFFSIFAIICVSIYGGYFNGGLGIMLLATFGLLGYENLHGMNGLKNLLSVILSLVSALTFITAGLIAWEQALIMAASATLGGYAGARVSLKIVRTDLLHHFVTTVGTIMTLAFFLR
ncbi:MAG: sulfite exporter TauE/SafE family protein [Roseibium album]|uniref:sulfite exporter TauE/SafE family protein n=1 Tax=Roseibium album TaxID=311410 RepID=UPI0018C8DBB7|nr:putative membrane protein YfcA [Labrenzia sp. EL_162]MBG6164128.1 putative membrane protein YfcA [Labrenzia sp. EL_195]MBG6198223.1 putative membrane protein YfcA [Labrenzia sp. EL_159]